MHIDAVALLPSIPDVHMSSRDDEDAQHSRALAGQPARIRGTNQSTQTKMKGAPSGSLMLSAWQAQAILFPGWRRLQCEADTVMTCRLHRHALLAMPKIGHL